MLSESAKMSSAAEARFRVQAPNSQPRAITVIALDAPGEDVVRRLSADPWTHATFLTAAGVSEGARSRVASDDLMVPLRDLSGQPRTLSDEVSTADLIVMVASAEGNAHAAEAIGRACSLRRVTTTTLLVGATESTDTALSTTLAQLRPWSLMLVLARDEAYIRDMLTALRA
jgi:hypothetical protein